MPGAFTHDFTLVRGAEATGDYTSIGALKQNPATNDDFRIEGTNAITRGVSSGSGVGTNHYLALTQSADQNWTGLHHFLWIKNLAWPSLANQAQGGQRIVISSLAPPAHVRSLLAATVTVGGSGYAVDNELTLVGGTVTNASAVVVVTAIGGGGAVTAVSPKRGSRGDYTTTLPTNPISTTGGGGSGCTLNVAGTGNPPTGWIYTTTQSKEWFIGGADTVAVAGWVCYVVEVDGQPDLSTPGASMSSVDRAGHAITAVAATKGITSVHDVSYTGTGITVNDGTGGAPVTFEDVRTYDNNSTRAFGVVTAQGGIFFLAGKLRIGTSGQTAVTVFKDTDQVVVCQAFPVNTAFYEIVLVGNASFPTTFQLGNFETVTSGGCTIRGANRYTHYAGVATGLVPAIWTLAANAANTICKLYGSTLSQMLSGAFNAATEIRSCTFQSCGTLTPGGALIDSCTFLDLATIAPISAIYQVSITNAATKLTNCTLINCQKGVYWNVNADPNTRLDNTQFTRGGAGHGLEFGPNTPGNTDDSDTITISLTGVGFTNYGGTPGANLTENSGSTDAAILNTSGKRLAINIIGGGDVPSVRNSGSGSKTQIITNQRTFSFVVENQAGATVTGYEWRLYVKDPDPGIIGSVELAGAEGISPPTDGSESYVYTYAGDMDAVLQIIHDDYIEQITTVLLIDANQEIAVVLRPEANI
jgi:hypothetical protein